MAPLNPYAVPYQPAASKSKGASIEVEQGMTQSLTDLPPEVTTTIITWLDAPADVVACGLVCKPLLSQVASADLSLDLGGGSGGGGGARPQHLQLSSPMSPTTAQLVASLPKYMHGVVRLDLSGLALEDKDVAALLAGLPRLQHLDLAACRKLTTQLVADMVSGNALGGRTGVAAAGVALGQAGAGNQVAYGAGGNGEMVGMVGPGEGSVGGLSEGGLRDVSMGQAGAAGPAARSLGSSSSGSSRSSSLRLLNLQRCFQLRDSALSHLLAGAAAGTLPLTALALSHLDLALWPWPAATPPTPAPPQQPPATDLTDLSDNIDQRFEATLATILPSVTPVTVAIGVSSSPASAPRLILTTPLTVLALNNCGGVRVGAVAALAVLCPQLQYLMLGGCSLVPYAAGTTSNGGGAVPAMAVSAAVSGGGFIESFLPDAMARRVPALRMQLQQAGCISGGGSAVRGAPWMVEVASCVSAALLTLTRLRAVELTFVPQPLVACIAISMKQSNGGTGAQVWDLTQSPCVQQALDALSNTSHAAAASGAERGAGRGEPVAVAALRLALRCAANCSNGARVAPAHVAAERGDASALRGILSLGGGVDSKERAGATPLFLASEAGHVECVRVLLEAGADPQLSNSAGERPLYIAALRGHLHVLTLLLDNCALRGIPWQDATLYCDSWTPLMAAAVADRHDVALALLRAADSAAERDRRAAVNGTTTSPGCQQGGRGAAGDEALAAGGGGAAALVRAVNRYGQCVLHIAARKASLRLLRLLLSCAGGNPTTDMPHGPCGGGGYLPVAGVLMPDGNGDTPLDVARKHRNAPALDELTRRMGHMQRGGAQLTVR